MSSRFRATAALVALAASATSASAQSKIQFKSRELQEGRNYTQKLTAVLATGQMSGQATYRYAIDVPAGRGITPEVALEYASGAGYSEYGWGWDLTLPTIERSSQHGVPSYTQQDTYQFR